MVPSSRTNATISTVRDAIGLCCERSEQKIFLTVIRDLFLF